MYKWTLSVTEGLFQRHNFFSYIPQCQQAKLQTGGHSTQTNGGALLACWTCHNIYTRTSSQRQAAEKSQSIQLVHVQSRGPKKPAGGRAEAKKVADKTIWHANFVIPNALFPRANCFPCPSSSYCKRAGWTFCSLLLRCYRTWSSLLIVGVFNSLIVCLGVKPYSYPTLAIEIQQWLYISLGMAVWCVPSQRLKLMPHYYSVPLKYACMWPMQLKKSDVIAVTKKHFRFFLLFCERMEVWIRFILWLTIFFN
jgi:hypothetical protein